MSSLQFSYISIADSNSKLPGCKVHCKNRPTGQEEIGNGNQKSDM